MNDAEDSESEAVETLSPAALADRVERGERVSLLDVRDRDEFERWRVDGGGVDAVQVPYIKFVQAEVQDRVADLVADAGLEAPVVVVCARGEASAAVAGILSEADIEAVNLAGGMEAWARLAVPRELPGTAATVVQYHRPSSGCLSYLVASDGEAAVVDPLRAFADRYVDDAAERGATLRYAVDTHVHADHVSGVRAVADRSDAAVVLPAGARERGLAFDARTVSDGDELSVGDATLTALRAPGHTPEMTAVRLEDLLFAGDSLFLRSVARPDLAPGADGVEAAARRLHRTLRERIFPLPDDTRVAPAHVGPATAPDDDGTYTARLGDLRERIGARSPSEDAFVEAVLDDAPPRPANHESIVEVNLGRESVADDEAFELELGPNNCAVD